MPLTDVVPMEPKGSRELYDKAVELCQSAYRKPQWSKEKYGKSMGHFIKSVFGKNFWTLKDLNDNQLKKMIHYAELKLAKKRYAGGVIYQHKQN